MLSANEEALIQQSWDAYAIEGLGRKPRVGIDSKVGFDFASLSLDDSQNQTLDHDMDSHPTILDPQLKSKRSDSGMTLEVASHPLSPSSNLSPLSSKSLPSKRLFTSIPSKPRRQSKSDSSNSIHSHPFHHPTLPAFRNSSSPSSSRTNRALGSRTNHVSPCSPPAVSLVDNSTSSSRSLSPFQIGVVGEVDDDDDDDDDDDHDEDDDDDDDDEGEVLMETCLAQESSITRLNFSTTSSSSTSLQPSFLIPSPYTLPLCPRVNLSLFGRLVGFIDNVLTPSTRQVFQIIADSQRLDPSLESLGSSIQSLPRPKIHPSVLQETFLRLSLSTFQSLIPSLLIFSPPSFSLHLKTFHVESLVLSVLQSLSLAKDDCEWNERNEVWGVCGLLMGVIWKSCFLFETENWKRIELGLEEILRDKGVGLERKELGVLIQCGLS